MTKKEIFEKLEEIKLDRNEYRIIGDASIVCHGLLKSTENIEIETKKEYQQEGFICYQNNYKEDESDQIKNFFFESIKNCLIKKKNANNINDKSIIKKMELYLDCQDTYQYERKLREEGITYIGGVDEVGRGPLVGPVVAACCILPETFHLEGLTDSKKLSEKKRDYYFEEIKHQAISYGIGIVDEKRIDEVNIYEATKEAMIQAINNCHIKPEHVLTDAMKLEIDIPITPIIKGDLRSITISAASVLAKVTRDRMLMELDEKYPMYDFKHNVGYPTKKHLEAIKKYGIIKEHRKSYGPVKDYLENCQERKKED